MKHDKVTPTEAALILGTSAQYIRVAMQQGMLDIGCYIKRGSRHTYNIQVDRLSAYAGRDVRPELQRLRENIA